MKDGELSGFSIDLWREIALRLNLRTEFNLHATLDEVLETVKEKKDDLAISAISITAQREEIFEFSQPMFNSGLSILVPANKAGGIFGILETFAWGDIFQFLLFFLVLVLIPAHVVWFVERKNEANISPSYFPGIFDALFWSAAIIGGQAEGYPKSHLSRFVALFCIYGSILFVAYFTAFMTTSLTVQQLKGDISSPSDLQGKRVATIKGSTAAQYLKGIGVTLVEMHNVEDAIDAMLLGKAVAVVYDSPVLLYYVTHESNGKVQIVGDSFRNENYGIVFPVGSELRKRVNEQLLSIRENGTYKELYTKWFGHSNQ